MCLLTFVLCSLNCAVLARARSDFVFAIVVVAALESRFVRLVAAEFCGCAVLSDVQRGRRAKSLVRFDSAAACAAWRVTSDGEFGGHSTATFEFNAARQCGVFRGRLDLSTAGTRMKQSGFAAITSPSFARAVDLTAYAALRFRVRTRGGVFISNLKTDSRVPDDLFQCFLLSPGTAQTHRPTTSYARIVSPYAVDVQPARSTAAAPLQRGGDGAGDDAFEVLDLPFHAYALTWRGFVEDADVRLDPFDVTGLGILMAERRTGEFELDVHSIEAVSEAQLASEKTRFQC